MYMVISKPKRMSVAAGVVQFMLISFKVKHTALVCILIIRCFHRKVHTDNHYFTFVELAIAL
jgi:hypothetical protein